VHVVLRIGPWRDRIRNRDGYAAIHKVTSKLYGDGSFRVCHVSIQHNHIHLLVEATDERALSKGMQRFAIRTAKSINTREGLVGQLFQHRYHATQITTSSHARHALSYVLNNWRRHREDRRKEGVPVDNYSSGISFDGWRGSPDLELYAELDPLPVSKPMTWLLAEGWRAHGEIDVYERPGPRESRCDSAPKVCCENKIRKERWLERWAVGRCRRQLSTAGLALSRGRATAAPLPCASRTPHRPGA
jgi:REP element-mobilizing transposase RayT